MKSCISFESLETSQPLRDPGKCAFLEMTSRKRSGSGSSKRPKEKVVYIYELFFRGEDPTANSAEFWNEFFLLQANVESLEQEVLKLNPELFALVRPNLQTLVQKCIEMLETGNVVFLEISHLKDECK